MFALHLEPIGEGADVELEVGEWAEARELGCRIWSPERFLQQWRVALQRMLDRSEPVALMLDLPSLPLMPGAQLPAWVCFPEGNRVFVQFKEFVVGENAVRLDDEFQLIGIEPRETFTDYGLPIAERYCELSDIESYLALGVAG